MKPMPRSIHRFALAVASIVWALTAPAMAMGERTAADGPNPPLYRLTPPGSGCIVGGCSGELCTNASNGDMMSTCEYRAEYACYQKHGVCKRQSDGNCGWTMTAAMKQCLANPPALGGAAAY
jgi:hypothetical protein